MSKPHNIFISWSGLRSRWIAETLRDWLPMIVQAANPWMSASDIDKGSRGLPEVSKALDGMKVGIVCLTPENLTAPWILYESGALSKSIDDKSRLWDKSSGWFELSRREAAAWYVSVDCRQR
jgi:hypothetical protein